MHDHILSFISFYSIRGIAESSILCETANSVHMSQKEEGMRLFLITAYLFPKVMLCALVIIISFYTENFIDNYFDV